MLSNNHGLPDIRHNSRWYRLSKKSFYILFIPHFVERKRIDLFLQGNAMQSGLRIRPNPGLLIGSRSSFNNMVGSGSSFQNLVCFGSGSGIHLDSKSIKKLVLDPDPDCFSMVGRTRGFKVGSGSGIVAATAALRTTRGSPYVRPSVRLF